MEARQLALGGLVNLAYVKRSQANGPARPALCAWAFFYGPMGEEPFYFLEKKKNKNNISRFWPVGFYP
jgi:hypothetical protein